MIAEVNIKAGICGFKTKVIAECEGMLKPCKIIIDSDCENIKRLAANITEVKGIEEITLGFEGAILSEVRRNLKSGCAGCAVPAGIFKAMQVASDLALPKDVEITITKKDN